MGVLIRPLQLRGSKGRMEAEGIFDTGASYSFIRRDLAEQLATLEPLVEPRQFQTAQEGRRLAATYHVLIEFQLNDFWFSDEFIVLDELARPVIIGAKTMQAWRMKLDMEEEEVVFNPRVTELLLI